MTKSKLLDTLILILLYIGISCFPFSLFGIKGTLELIFQILCQLVIFFLFRLVLKKSPLKFKERTYNRFYMILFIPVFILCFSNYFNLFSPDHHLEFSFSIDLLLAILLSFCVAFNEEYLFRSVIIDNIEASEKPIVKIIISASIFGISHITYFISSFNPVDLLHVVYTFGLGIVLGLMYVYGQCLWYCVLFHFAFNVINGNLVEKFMIGPRNFMYYLVNGLVGLVIGIYLFVIYFLIFRKEKTEEWDFPNLLTTHS